MEWMFAAEQISIEIRLMAGEITEAEAAREMLALYERMQRHLALLGALATITPVIVIGGLVMLALRLGTFG